MKHQARLKRISDVSDANIWFRFVVNTFQTGKSSVQVSAVP